MILLSLFLCTALVAGGAEPNFGDAYNSAVLMLKGKTIPSDGTGVVIFKDIGGYLGPEDGLVCTASFSNFTDQHWLYPNGSLITTSPSINVYGINASTCTCDTERGGVSLYYSGQPVERGRFVCSLELYPKLLVNLSVYIVDIENTKLYLIGPGKIVIAGENIQLWVNITVSPEGIPMPYQWLVNGTNLPLHDSKYQSTQNGTLTIFNAQIEDTGKYSCSVAHSASGMTRSVQITVVSITVSVISLSTADLSIGHPYTLSCALYGDGPLTNLNPTFNYAWNFNGVSLEETTDTHKFESVAFHNAGNYKCQVFVKFDRPFGTATINYTSQEFSLTIPDVVYRIYLRNIQNCYQWIETSSINKKLNDINTKIMNGIQNKCQIPNYLYRIKNEDRAYKCPDKHSIIKNSVIYDAHLQGTSQANTTLLVSCLDKWISDSKYIEVNGVEHGINKECTGVLDEGTATECPTSDVIDGHKPNWMAIGFGTATAILSVVTLILSIISTYCWYKRRCGYQPPDR